MHRTPVGLAVAVFVALLALPAASQARSPLQVGVADDATLFGDPETARRSVEEWQRNGVDTVRIQVSWARVAPAPASPTPPEGFNPKDPDSPGYEWRSIDSAVDRVASAGMEPILMIDGPPPLWASSRPSLRNPRYRPRATAFGPFAAAVAKRYGDRVTHYILWNEPNLPLWIQPQATCDRQRRCTPLSPDLYRAMVHEAYKPIHEADADAVVLIGALAPSGSNLTSANANMRPLQFLRAFGCLDVNLRPIATGGCRSFRPAPADGFAYHPHSTRRAPDQPYANPDDADLASLSKVERLLDQLQQRGRLQGAAPLNIWLDEYGYQTDPPDKARGVSLARQDRYLQQAAYLAWRRPRVQLLANYLWNDEALTGGRLYSGWQSGLIDLRGRDKPALVNFASPMWVDAERTTIWGQFRAGATHTVTIEMRPPGSGSSWQTLAVVPTGPDGAWYVRARIVPYASYRATAEDGRRTATVVAADEPDDGLASSGTETTADGTPVVRRTIKASAGTPVPPSFAGMSIEYWSAQDYLGSGGRVNAVFAKLLSNLRTAGSAPPTIRLGGNSTDDTWWNPDRAARPPGLSIDLDQTWVSQLRTWATATRTPMVLGLNFALGDPANAVGWVQGLSTAMPRGTLAGFEVGNEPDRYTQPHTFHVNRRAVTRVQRRDDGYSFRQYTDELARFTSTLSPAAAGAAFAGGGFAGGGWDSNTDALLDGAGATVRAFHAHSYGIQACGAAARRRTKASFARALLASSGTSPIVARMRHLAAVAISHGAAFRVSEANSANCGGVDGVSNAFVSALWGTDLLFGLAQAGVANVDFHAWTGANYSPVDFVFANGKTVARVRPLYYGMLLFNRAFPPGARLLPVARNSQSASTKTWATLDGQGTRRVVVLNKDPAKARMVVLSLPGAGATATIERLTAPSVLSKENVTFAGQTFGPSTTDGQLVGDRVTETVQRRGGRFRIAMPAGSAALVTVAG